MDNLIAEEKVKPFIIVMTYGMTNEVRIGGLRNFDIKDFETVLVDELVPYVDQHFRTLTDQPNRAMAGLSMGSMETKSITLRNLDKFSHIGLFSGATISKEDVENTEGFKDKVKLVFVSYGSKEVGGDRPRRGGDPADSVKQLKELGDQCPLLFVARNSSRMAIVATQFERVRSAVVPTRRQALGNLGH